MTRRVATLLLVVMLLAFVAAVPLLLSTYAEAARGERTLSFREVLGGLAVVAAPVLVAFVVRHTRRSRSLVRLQREALLRMMPNAVLFDTWAEPQTVAALNRLRAATGGEAPLRADHLPLTVSVTQNDVSVWGGGGSPRRVLTIPAGGVVTVQSQPVSRVVPGTGKTVARQAVRLLFQWHGRITELTLPVLIVTPLFTQASVMDAETVVRRVRDTLPAPLLPPPAWHGER